MNEQSKQLIAKYNVAAPRYTSYPTVPFWNQEAFYVAGWKNALRTSFLRSNDQGISLYIHLPFCESLCTYCGCNTRITKNHGVELPYLTYLLKEWEMYKTWLGDNIRLSDLHLGGGTPTFFASENLTWFLQTLLDGLIVDDQTAFSFEAHPANTTSAHLKALYALGFRRLSLGIQDFDPQVQYLINRHQSVEDVQRVMQEARKIGYSSINFDLIYGLPLQNEHTVRETVAAALAMRPDRISFYSYAHVPWLKPGQRRFTEHDLPVGNTKLALYQLGKQLIEEQGYRDVGMDHFALVEDALFIASELGKLHRNFMGYTDRYTPVLIGLGVSSISDAWSAFAQNVKTVEEYYRLLDEGNLPVVKGHLLDDEDVIIRTYILDLMCRSSVKFIPGFPLNAVILARLRPLLEDGLVDLTERGELSVTAAGQPFLRNICMCFDQRLHETRAAENVFSQAI